MDKKQNPSNSDTLQALLDIQAAMDRLNYGLTDIRDIIADMQQEQSELRMAADQINHLHRYPDRVIEFSQSARYDAKALFYELPRGEQLLFNLMCDIQDPQTGFVTVIKRMFVQVLHFTDTERKHLQLYLDDLTEKGFLICHYRATNKKPGEYQVNQGLSWIGKRQKTELRRLQKFQSEYTIGKATVVCADGKKLTSGTLQIRDTAGIIKKGAGLDQSTNSSQSTPSSATNQHNNRQPATENQEKLSNPAFSMQNALTAEENELFSRDELPENPAYSIHNDTKEE